jgi:NAD+ diphosphatase
LIAGGVELENISGNILRSSMLAARYPTPMFSENSLDRMDHLRSTAKDYLDLKAHPYTRFIVISEGCVVLRHVDQQVLFLHQDLEKIPIDEASTVFLGTKGDDYFFAFPYKGDVATGFEKVDLKSFAAQNFLPDAEMGMIAQANSVLKWHENHGFCAKCGANTASAYGGWRRDCDACGTQHFPRTDPVVIMLVTYRDHCLLGAGRGFQEQRYSCLAGFMEPGETIEDAARRELFEEAGVIATQVEYMFSQPWPFPSSIMIGVHMEAKSMEVKVDGTELTDAKWVSKSDIDAVLKGATDRGFVLPPRIAIARTMLEAWVS